MRRHWKALLAIGLLTGAVRAQSEEVDTSADTHGPLPVWDEAPDAPAVQADQSDSQQPAPVSEPRVIDPPAEPSAVEEISEDELASPTVELRQRLRQQVESLCRQPQEGATRRAVHRQLLGLNRANIYRAQAEIEPSEQLDSLNMLAQGLYVQVTRFTEPRLADRHISRLRITARQAKAVDHARAEAIGDFWLLAADLYEINHSELSTSARQVQAAELMSEYLGAHPDAEAAPGVSDALQQLKGARLERLLQWTPDAVAGESDRSERKAMVRLIRLLHEQLPVRWWIHNIAVGRTTPVHWKTGQGTQITLQRIGYRPIDMKRGKGGVVEVWIMDKDYVPQRSVHGTAAAAAESQTGPAGDLAWWRGRKVFVWGDTDGDWDANTLVAAQLKATDEKIQTGASEESDAPADSEEATSEETTVTETETE